LDRSESALAQAVHLAPGSAVYWLNYAVTLEQNKKDAEADQAYRQALDRHPDWQPAYFWRETPLRLQAWRSWSVDQPVSDTSSLEELERTAQAAPDLATNHLALARAYLDDQRWEQAANSLALARLAYAATAGTSVEIDWLTAEVYAGQGDYQQAVVFGDRALSNQVHQGLFGPGSYGILYYVEFMFRRPAVPDDLVPQTLLVAMPDAWGYRVLDLVGWHRALGAHARADDLMQQLAIWIPDYPYILVEGGS
jgi:tetratricopeptide (TPR) repeat protein